MWTYISRKWVMASLARRIAGGRLNQLLVPTKHVDKMSKIADDIPVSCTQISSDPVQHRWQTYHNSTQFKSNISTNGSRMAKRDTVNNKKGLLMQTVARDSAPWWIVIQYWQLAENGAFFIPLSYSAPPLPIFPLEFCGEVMRQETRVIGLLCGEGCVILTVTVFDWSTRVTDSGTDRQTDRRTGDGI